MKPSVWTNYLMEPLPRGMVKIFAVHGWQTLELGEEHGHDLLKEGKPEKVGAEFKRYAAGEGITFRQGHFCMWNKGCRPEDQAGRLRIDIAPADDEDFRLVMEYMKRWVDLFGAIGIQAGVIHAGGEALASLGWTREQILERRAEALRQVAGYARGGPTVICVENTSSAGSGTIEEMLSLIQAVGLDNTGICLDTGHANMAGIDQADFIRRAKGRLKALHIADNLGSNDDHMLPFGRGTVPWGSVLEALGEIGYQGLFNFEVPGENRCPEPVLLAKLDYMRYLADCMIETALAGRGGTGE